MTVHKTRAQDLIKQVAEILKEKEVIEPPEWAWHVKTGVHKENIPENDEWWYNRAASLLRKIYLYSPDGIGVERLRTIYGGPQNRGPRPTKHRKASGNIIRKALQQLEKLNYVKTVKGKGRVITSEGRSFLDNISHKLASDNKKLEKYI